MAVVPLDVATRGYLDSPLSVAADGYLSLGAAPSGPKGGGPFNGARWRHPYLDIDERERRRELLVAREDEEILAVIMAFMRMIQ